MSDHRKMVRGGGTFLVRDNPELVEKVRRMRANMRANRMAIGADEGVQVEEPRVPLQFQLLAAAARAGGKWGPLED